jgi:hypothetical protein
MKARKNPYASKLKKPVTLRLSEDVVEYFKGMADEAGVPYQSLINLYLRDSLQATCLSGLRTPRMAAHASERRPSSVWRASLMGRKQAADVRPVTDCSRSGD